MESPDIEMSCPECRELFKFPKEGIGQTAPCPHCGKEIVLAEPKVKTAVRRKSVSYYGGREGWLHFAGGLIAFVLMCIGLILGFLSMADGFKLPVFIEAVACILSGLFTLAVCLGLAEVIRLLKKMNGLDYEGEIAPVQVREIRYQCSKCNTLVNETVWKCPECGAEFEK